MEDELEPEIIIERVLQNSAVAVAPLIQETAPKIQQPNLSRAQQILQRAQQKHKSIVPLKSSAPPPTALKTALPKFVVPPPPPLRTNSVKMSVVSPPRPQQVAVKMSSTPPPKLEQTQIEQGIEHIKASLTRKLNGDKCAFASSGRTDGIADQALGKITVKVMATALGMLYTHAPFQVTNQPDINVQKWEQMLGIGGSNTPYVKPLIQYLPHTKHMECINLNRNLPCQTFLSNHAHIYKDAHSFTNFFRDDLTDAWRDVIHELRTRYTGPRTGVFDRTDDSLSEDVKHVAIHHDVTLPTTYYANIMSKLPLANYVLHIFTEQDNDTFDELLLKYPIKIHKITPSSTHTQTQLFPRNHVYANRRTPVRLVQSGLQNILPDEVFKMLVGADILIMSKTSMSYLAGIYSSGIKIQPPDFHLKIPKWCEQNDQWSESEI